jgi:hypothetical protein
MPALRGSACLRIGSQGLRPGLLHGARFAGFSILRLPPLHFWERNQLRKVLEEVKLGEVRRVGA